MHFCDRMKGNLEYHMIVPEKVDAKQDKVNTKSEKVANKPSLKLTTHSALHIME